MVKKKVKKTSKISENSKAYAFLASFLLIYGVILGLLTKKDNAFVKHYITHGIILTLSIVVLSTVATVLLIIPILGWIAYVAAWIIWIIIWFNSWLNALHGVKNL
jgi:uncharacterized membrane protein